MAASTSRARVGLGTKINFALSGSKGEIIETVSWGIDGGDAIDATHMDVPPIDGDGIRTNAEMIPREIARLQPMTFTAHFDEALGLPQLNFPETIELVLRRRSGQLTPAKMSATGWVSNVAFDLPVNEKSVVRMTVSFTGNFVYVRPLLAA
jgi:hypothetical protein